MLTKREIFERKGEEVVLDIELYPNYFLVCIEYVKGGKVWFEGLEFNRRMLHWILMNNTVITFNGNKFDMPIVMYALMAPEYTEYDLFRLGQDLIGGYIRPWQVGQGYIDWKSTGLDHIDLIELAIGQSSLKTYAGRIHAPYMQDLPYPFNTELNEEQKQNVLKYCWNDTNNTKLLKQKLQKQIDLRIEMSRTYQIDLRSKSDAQIAEAVIARELKWKHGVNAKPPSIDTSYSFKYNVPHNIKFKTKQLNEALEVIRNATFTLSEAGKLVMPAEIGRLKIKIGETTYTLGMGGLHSTENWLYREAGDKYVLVDRDVTSYYPSIIIQQKLFPKQLTRAFLEVYKGIVDRRVAAKKAGDKIVNEVLKIVINGSFGKFGNMYSILFSPDLLIQTTVSGQLYLLMLIEAIELAKMSVFSGNTDGFVTQIPKERKVDFDAIVAEWEKQTGLETEETEYVKYAARDVNNYVAVKPNGDIKTKGYFGDFGLAKNPAGAIIGKAVSEYFAKGTPVEETVNNEEDMKMFMFIRKVEGGCIDQKKQPVGKVVRWYIAKGEFHPLRYESNNNKVPDTDGARIFMDLTVPFPEDIDRQYYIRKAKDLIKNITKPPINQMELFEW